MSELHKVKSGGFSSGEVIVTDDEVGIVRDPYLEVARRLLNEVIETIVVMGSGAITPDQLKKERAKHEREMRKWAEANKVLKEAAQGLVQENERLENEIARLEVERDNLRGQLNEALMRQTDVARKLHDYPLTEHMTERAQEKWEELKKMMSARPTTKGE